ncbi:hypothetical protein IJD15_01050 [bacterium]|nr:hypothetical protein [bacterium]
MFNLKQFKLVKNLKTKPQTGWLSFSSLRKNQTRNEFLDSVITDNKFVQEDLKLRAMVEEMLQKEFPERIKDKKNYDFLVDSVVNKLKQKQLGNVAPLEENLN